MHQGAQVIRVAMVDTSLADRVAAHRVLGCVPDILVVGSARSEREALELVLRTRPSVVIMGLSGDGADCYDAVRQIMAHCPTPILLLADRGWARGEMLARMLSAGALDVVERAWTSDGHATDRPRQDLLSRVRLLAKVPVVTHLAGKLRPAEAGRRGPGVARPGARAAVAVAASTGGPVALARLLSSLPADLPAPVLVVQHIAKGFIQGLAAWFGEQCSLRVGVAEQGDVAVPGTVLLAPDECHMTVGRGGEIRLDQQSPPAGIRPSGDRLFESVANVYGSRAIVVVLTGMGSDGMLGALQVKRAGGRVIAQDESTSTIFGMPRAVIEASAADAVLPLGSIGDRLVEWIGNQDTGHRNRT